MPDEPPPPEVRFVDRADEIPGALAAVDRPVVGVDVERADADRYFRRAALVQVGIDQTCVLLDGVTLEEMPDLHALLDADHLAVLHAVENDLEPLAAKGVVPARFADTAVAAALLGLPTGLGGLLLEVLEVELTADKEAYQRADWAARPLSEGMAAYAAGDVVHLPALWLELDHRLRAAGRQDWYEQELAWIVARASEDTRDWTRVKGAGRLDPSQRAVLRSLWTERERLAREHDIAPNRLLHDDVLRELSTTPPASPDELVRRSTRRRGTLRPHARALFRAFERGTQAPPEVRNNDDGNRWAGEDRATFDALRKARAAVADDLGLDPGVLCPSRPLQRAIGGRPRDADELVRLAELRPWQADLLRDVLWDAYERPPEAAADADGS